MAFRTLILLLSLVLQVENNFDAITFRVRRSRGEMYIGHARLCASLSLAAFPQYCTDPDATWEE